MPTPCDLLVATSSVVSGNPDQITIAFDVINNSESCVATPTSGRFSVEAIASEFSDIKATFMDQPIILNLINALPGETPAEFEVYSKG